nr:hypothetical protein BCU42_23595 [Vibrio splendidus]PMI77452.1 hypothetical protein BCU38_24115 [Vibrio splendidus]
MGCNRQRGVASIEFSLSFMAFFLMCAFLVELSFMSYTIAVSDYALSQAARESKVTFSTAKTGNGRYSHAFNRLLKKNQSVWGAFIDPSKFNFKIAFLRDLSQLRSFDGSCFSTKNICGSAQNSPIAIYQITYDYQPLFSYFVPRSMSFTREAIVIQEFQREKFKI